MKVVRLSASRTGHLYPKKCSWYSFSLETESIPGPWCSRKEYVTEKYSDTTGNRSRDRPASSAAPPQTPYIYTHTVMYFQYHVFRDDTDSFRRAHTFPLFIFCNLHHKYWLFQHTFANFSFYCFIKFVLSAMILQSYIISASSILLTVLQPFLFPICLVPNSTVKFRNSFYKNRQIATWNQNIAIFSFEWTFLGCNKLLASV